MANHDASPTTFSRTSPRFIRAQAGTGKYGQTREHLRHRVRSRPPPHSHDEATITIFFMDLTLVTFLGKGRVDAATGYRSATYQFPDRRRRTTPFFGLALTEVLQPERLVIFGTSGSMWGVLLEHLATLHAMKPIDDELRQAEAESRVDQGLLDRAAVALSSGLDTDVHLGLISSAQTALEQIDLLSAIDHAVPREGELHIDVTHGFRHLGMMGLLSADLLQRMRPGLHVHSLWYGALDMTRDGVTPVLTLDGIQAVQLWIRAFDQFEVSDDYGLFAPLLEADGLPPRTAQRLTEASLFESLGNVYEAARCIGEVLPALARPLPGASGLFQDTLRGRLLWATASDFGGQQRELAMRALRRGDMPRALLMGLEAVVTRLCVEEGADPKNVDDRLRLSETYHKKAKQRELPLEAARAFMTLKSLRNAYAHGTVPSHGRTKSIWESPQNLPQEVKRSLDVLLGS